MKTRKIGKEEFYKRYYVILERGDEIISKLKQFAQENKITGGSLLGVGTLKNPELGFFDLDKKQYVKKQLKGEFELLSLNGNISQFAGDTVIHIHALVSDVNFQAFGGHLFSAQITGTGEIIIDTMGEIIERKHSEKENLNLIEL